MLLGRPQRSTKTQHELLHRNGAQETRIQGVFRWWSLPPPTTCCVARRRPWLSGPLGPICERKESLAGWKPDGQTHSSWVMWKGLSCCSLFSRSVVSDSLRLYGLQHSRHPCPSRSPEVCSKSCPLSQWCHEVPRKHEYRGCVTVKSQVDVSLWRCRQVSPERCFCSLRVLAGHSTPTSPAVAPKYESCLPWMLIAPPPTPRPLTIGHRGKTKLPCM